MRKGGKVRVTRNLINPDDPQKLVGRTGVVTLMATLDHIEVRLDPPGSRVLAFEFDELETIAS